MSRFIQRVQYMCINEKEDHGALFLALVDKGFNKPAAFTCLERVRTDFLKFFDQNQIQKAKAFSLNSQFREVLKRAHVI